MKNAFLVAWLFWAVTASAAVLNVEFHFSPYTGDRKADKVEQVAGQARVLVNGVPVARQEVVAQQVPVLFEQREVAAAVWAPAASLGSSVRKGTNRIRIEFTPADGSKPYRALFRYATVTDQVIRTETSPGHFSETNQTGVGEEEKSVTGPVSFEREFDADFVEDRPWHHQPAVTSLSDADRQSLKQLVRDRAAAFKPGFQPIYQELSGITNSSMQLNSEAIRKSKCLDKAYAAGVRIVPAADLDIVTTGNPEIVVSAKSGQLFGPEDSKAFSRIKGNDMQMCIGVVLGVYYPQQMLVVRGSEDKWMVVR